MREPCFLEILCPVIDKNGIDITLMKTKLKLARKHIEEQAEKYNIDILTNAA